MTQTRNQDGWTQEMNDIHDSFHLHRQLLLTLMRLDFIDSREVGILQRDFESNTWSKIRDGDDNEYN